MIRSCTHIHTHTHTHTHTHIHTHACIHIQHVNILRAQVNLRTGGLFPHETQCDAVEFWDQLCVIDRDQLKDDKFPPLYNKFDVLQEEFYQCNSCGTPHFRRDPKTAGRTAVMRVPIQKCTSLQYALNHLADRTVVKEYTCIDPQCSPRRSTRTRSTKKGNKTNKGTPASNKTTAQTCQLTTECSEFLVLALGRFDDLGNKINKHDISIDAVHAITQHIDPQAEGDGLTYDTVYFVKVTCYGMACPNTLLHHLIGIHCTPSRRKPHGRTLHRVCTLWRQLVRLQRRACGSNRMGRSEETIKQGCISGCATATGRGSCLS